MGRDAVNHAGGEMHLRGFPGADYDHRLPVSLMFYGLLEFSSSCLTTMQLESRLSCSSSYLSLSLVSFLIFYV